MDMNVQRQHQLPAVLEVCNRMRRSFTSLIADPKYSQAAAVTACQQQLPFSAHPSKEMHCD
jgi:hypothetical protein